MTTPVKPVVVFGTLGPANAGLRMSVKEFLEHDDWERGPRYQLIAGVLIVSPEVSGGERFPNDELAYLLRNYRDAHPEFDLSDTAYECDVRTSIGIRRVDRAIYMNLGRPAESLDIPTIIIEFVSEGSRNAERDYVEKREEFAAIGVKEYWVIDRFDRTLTVFAGTAEPIQESESYSTPLLPGFVLPVRKILDIADRHSKKKK